MRVPVPRTIRVQVNPQPPDGASKGPGAGAGAGVMSQFLRRMLVVLPLYDRPTSWLLRLWQLVCGGRVGSSLALVAATGSFLKAVLDSPDLNRRCMALMDVATMLGTVFYQVTFTNRRAMTRGMLEQLVVLAEEVEGSAGLDEVADLRGTVRSMRRTYNFMASFVATVLSLMLATPLLVGELTMSVYPRPEGVLWLLTLFTQEFATLTCAFCVGTIMFTLLLISFGVASLARCLSLRLQTSSGEAAMVQLVRLHRLVLEVSDRMAEVYSLTLFCLITGYLTVSLLGTFNVATGAFDPYTVAIVPGALLFYFIIATISDVLYTSTAGICEAGWGCQWTEEAVPVRRLVLNLITRAQRPACVRVPLLGAVTLPVFMDSMRQWYSFLQMIRNVNQ